MTDNLCPEIKIDGKRPDWLKGDEKIGIVWAHMRWDNLNTPADCVRGWEDSVAAIMLRADHPYYAATSNGFTYWPGGENAPDDWDGGEVLLRDHDGLCPPAGIVTWERLEYSSDIIGYRKRAEPVQNDDDYVRVKRMTRDEYDGSISWARRVGIIREETAIEQFERGFGALNHESRHAVNAFIEWQNNHG